MSLALRAHQPVEIQREPTAAADNWVASGFATVYREHSQAIYYLALRLLGNPTSAEDATHDVFLKAYRKFHTFRGDAAIRTWLYRIAVNHCQNLLQSWHRRHIVTGLDDHLSPAQPVTAETPLRVLEIKELGQRIQRTLEALPEEYRLMLLLVADQELSYNEIAKLTDQSTDAVRGKLHRARKTFAALFTKTA
jgi:RNA polymerase sigma-70 factor, ECF subfamily